MEDRESWRRQRVRGENSHHLAEAFELLRWLSRGSGEPEVQLHDFGTLHRTGILHAQRYVSWWRNRYAVKVSVVVVGGGGGMMMMMMMMMMIMMMSIRDGCAAQLLCT